MIIFNKNKMGGGVNTMSTMWASASLEGYSYPYENKNSKRNAKVENRFTLPSHLLEAVDFRGMGVVEEPINSIPKFVEGEYYSLQGIACDGFEMKEKIYQLIGVVNEYKGTEINSVIVKQVAGEEGKIFTLSKNDCACLDIEYQTGLQLFPKNLPWKIVKDEIPFDWRNLGTTPLSNIDNTIRHILIRIDGFKDYSDGYVLSPSGKLITEEAFIKTLRIQTAEPIVYGNGFVLKDGKNLNANIVYPENLLYNHGNFISSDDTIYVLITLKQPGDAHIKDKRTIDGYFGVEQEYLNNVNPNDFFRISWDEFAAPTVEEYELEKAKAIERAERRVKMEEERKRKEAETKKKEKVRKKKSIDETIDYWFVKGGDMKPKRIRRPNIDTYHNSIESITRSVDAFEDYFNTLNAHLDGLGNNINFFINKF